jgi:hypothetical protein
VVGDKGGKKKEKKRSHKRGRWWQGGRGWHRGKKRRQPEASEEEKGDDDNGERGKVGKIKVAAKVRVKVCRWKIFLGFQFREYDNKGEFGISYKLLKF